MTKPRHFVYFDSTRKTFSVRDQKTRRVCLKSNTLVVRNCTFHVSQSGRERVLRTGRKAVHAGILGSARQPRHPNFKGYGWSQVKYNPRRDTSFVRVTDGFPVTRAAVVICVIEDGRARVFASQD